MILACPTLNSPFLETKPHLQCDLASLRSVRRSKHASATLGASAFSADRPRRPQRMSMHCNCVTSTVCVLVCVTGPWRCICRNLTDFDDVAVRRLASCYQCVAFGNIHLLNTYFTVFKLSTTLLGFSDWTGCCGSPSLHSLIIGLQAFLLVIILVHADPTGLPLRGPSDVDRVMGSFDNV